MATNETPAKPPTAENAPAPAASGGITAWIPLIVTIVAMPALAYAMTSFVLLPKIQKEIAAATPAPVESTGEAKPVAAAATAAKAKGGEKISVPLSKVLVNLAGSMGTRYLLTSLTLVGEGADFKAVVENNQAQLTDIAAGILGSKTIGDLEKPGARALVRTELLTVFNNALGAGTVQELYLTEFAVQ